MRKLLIAALLCQSTFALADIVVSEPYARAVPHGQLNSAAFMTLKNSGNKAVDLISASSPAAEHVELHTHSNVDGVMQMRPIDKVTIEANHATILKPGGHHVMLIGLQQELNEGDSIPMTFTFSDGTTQEKQLPIKFVMPMNMDHSKHTEQSTEHKHTH